MVPNARFMELLADIEPSPTTKSHSSAAHTSVRGHLQRHESFKDRWEDDFLAGSYARDTAIRPKKTADGHERPDVDIIMVTNFTSDDAPDDVLQELADALDDGGYDVERINKRSVRVLTSTAEIDVVPVFEWGNKYMLPDRDIDSWRGTDPPAHTAWSSARNKDFDRRFKPLVKLFKWWRREQRTGKRPKGFVIEVLVARYAPTDETHFGEAFAQMLDSIYREYGVLAAHNMKPAIDDPGYPGNDILSKVSITDWKAFIDRVRVHAGYARRAQDEEDMEEATRLWRKLFGDRFKVTANAAKAASLSSVVVAPAAAGLNYVFPETPAAPTKPRGFA